MQSPAVRNYHPSNMLNRCGPGGSRTGQVSGKCAAESTSIMLAVCDACNEWAEPDDEGLPASVQSAGRADHLRRRTHRIGVLHFGFHLARCEIGALIIFIIFFAEVIAPLKPRSSCSLVLYGFMLPSSASMDIAAAISACFKNLSMS